MHKSNTDPMCMVCLGAALGQACFIVLQMQQNEGNKWSLIAQTLTDSKRNKYIEDGDI